MSATKRTESSEAHRYRSLLEAVVEEPGNGVLCSIGDMDEQFVVEAQHDPCV